MNIGRNTKLILCVILAGWFCFNALTLTEYPVPMQDEAHYSVISYQFARYGTFSSPIHGGLAYQDINYSYSGRLWSLGLSILIATLGGSLFASRLYNLLAWMACCVLVYVIARRLYRREIGVLAALIMAFSTSAFVRFRMLRPDPWAGFAVLSLFWSTLYFRDRPNFKRSFVLGIACLLVLDVYINTAFFLPACGLFVLWIAFSRRDMRPVLGFGLGALLTAAGIILARLYPDAYAAYYQWWLMVPALQRMRVAIGNFGPASTGRWFWDYFVVANRGLSGVESLLALVGIGVAVRQRQADEVWLVAFYLTSLLLFGVFYSDKGWPHIAMWMPFLFMMAARALSKASEMVAARLQVTHPSQAPALVTPWLIVNLLAGLWLVYSHRTNDWPATARAVQALVPERAGLLAEGEWWFAHQEGPFTSSLSLFTLQFLNPDGVVSEQELVAYLRQNEVEYILLEAQSPYTLNILAPPSITVIELVDQYCLPTGTVDGYFTEGYRQATATIYRCNFWIGQPDSNGQPTN